MQKIYHNKMSRTGNSRSSFMRNIWAISRWVKSWKNLDSKLHPIRNSIRKQQNLSKSKNLMSFRKILPLFSSNTPISIKHKRMETTEYLEYFINVTCVSKKSKHQRLKHYLKTNNLPYLLIFCMEILKAYSQKLNNQRMHNLMKISNRGWVRFYQILVQNLINGQLNKKNGTFWKNFISNLLS